MVDWKAEVEKSSSFIENYNSDTDYSYDGRGVVTIYLITLNSSDLPSWELNTKNHYGHNNKKTWFTLVEMLVSMVILSSVIVISTQAYRQFVVNAEQFSNKYQQVLLSVQKESLFLKGLSKLFYISQIIGTYLVIQSYLFIGRVMKTSFFLSQG